MDKLFWIDMEMTGLDVETNNIIEVAAIITDMNFNTLETYHCVVNQPQHYLDAMDNWNKEHHKASGLLDKIPYGKDPQVAEKELIQLIQKHFKIIEGNKDSRPILCGNSIAQDRLFIDKYFKNLASLLHYRMLDVSSWKIIFRNKYKINFEKKNHHRALDDIQESINELMFYLSYLRVDSRF